MGRILKGKDGVSASLKNTTGVNLSSSELVPATSAGRTGDKKGDVAYDSSYLYYCATNYPSSSLINITSLLVPHMFDDVDGDTSYSSLVLTMDYTTFTSTYSYVTTDWQVYEGETYKRDITAINNISGGTYDGKTQLFLSSVVNFAGPQASANITIRAAVTNIWKRVAWSTDTWS